MNRLRIALWPFAILAVLFLCACGGGGGGDVTPPPPPPLSITTSSLPVALEGAAYSQTLQATGGTTPYTWSTSGTLPAGITLSSGGVVSGTSTYNGTESDFSFTAQVTDSASRTAQKSITFHAVGILTISPSTLPAGGSGIAYSQTFTAGAGTTPYTFSVPSGSLPPGMSLSSGGVLSGTPTTPGSYSFTVQVADAGSPQQTASVDVTLAIDGPVISTTSLPDGVQNIPYTAQLQATAGTPPYVWSVYGGVSSLPPGLTLDPSGLISGTPTTVGIWDLYIQVTDSDPTPRTSNSEVYITINAPLAVSTATLPSVVQNSTVDLELTASGANGTLTWSLASGTLPDGLTLGSNGHITGTPTTVGTSTFTVQVDDAGPPAQSATATLSLGVIAVSLGRNDTIATATALSNGTFAASISPMVDPPGGSIANPDVDVYVLTASPGATVRIETFADRLTPASPMDSVVEVVDAAGNRLQTCGYTDVDGRISPCMNDDIDLGVETDSLLFFQANPSASGPVTFYVRVSDWTGSARPDFLYSISISGAN